VLTRDREIARPSIFHPRDEDLSRVSGLTSGAAGDNVGDIPLICLGFLLLKAGACTI
jgi:hypothetical protein